MEVLLISIALIVGIILFIMTLFWVAGLFATTGSVSKCGFITYRKFKVLFNTVEWKVPHYDDEFKTMVKSDERGYAYANYKMYPSASMYMYDGKGMLPLTPIDEFLMKRLIKKEILKVSVGKSKNKLFIW